MKLALSAPYAMSSPASLYVRLFVWYALGQTVSTARFCTPMFLAL
jgi:hypothetical protein